jgi:hypothetical protein
MAHFPLFLYFSHGNPQMTFREWKKWFKELPWSCKWFVIFILIRPVTDNFYNLKEISPVYSPLYILGILRRYLFFSAFFQDGFPKSTVPRQMGRYGS